MIKIIAGISLDNSIGLRKNQLPWPKSVSKGDLSLFKKMTEHSVVIMGRRTFQSIGSNPLPSRRNIVITKDCSLERKVLTYNNLERAISDWENINDIYLIGGYNIFKEGQKYASEIILTEIPYIASGKHDVSDIIYFPRIDSNRFKNKTSLKHPYNDRLRIINYTV